MKILNFFLVIGVLSLLCQGCASPPSPESKQQEGKAPLVDLGKGICQQNNGLMWQGERTETFSSSQEALEYVRNLNLGSHGDWRLPSKEELYKLSHLFFVMKHAGDCPIKLKGSYWATNGEVHAGEWEAYPTCGGSELKYLKSKSGRVLAVRP